MAATRLLPSDRQTSGNWFLNLLPTDPKCAHIPFMEVSHAVRRVWLRHGQAVGMCDGVTDF